MQNGETILVVEDKTEDVLLLALAFRRLSIANPVQVVSNGFAAIQYLKGEGPYQNRAQFRIPRLTMLDLDLPLLSGFEFLEWLRQDPELRHLPVVAMTASDFPEDLDRADESGANSFLIKVSDLTEYTAALRQATSFWLGRGPSANASPPTHWLVSASDPADRRPNMGWRPNLLSRPGWLR
jgi:CheY-like chemotaxis protein